MGIQKHEVVMKEYVYDFAKDGGSTGAITLVPVDPGPALMEEGTLITDAMIVCETTVTSTGTPTMIVGPSADTDGYFKDVFGVVATAGQVVRAGEVDGDLLFNTTADAKRAYLVTSTANTQDLLMTIGTAPLTAGKLRVIVQCMKPGTLSRA